MRLIPIGAPVRPMSVTLVMDHLRVEHDAEGLEMQLIESYVDAALEWAEDFTRRSVFSQQYSLTLPSAGQVIELPRPPLLEVSRVSVDGRDLEPDAYEVRAECWPGVLELKEPPSGEVAIRFTAGYDEDSLPRQIRQAVLLLVGHWYEHRQEVSLGLNAMEVPMGAKALLWMTRMAL